MSNVVGTVQQETALLFAEFSVTGVCGPGTLSVTDHGGHFALGLAVLARGGACLAVLADRETARAAAKLGSTDFTVDSLSEALRILKNEIRQRRAVSVGVVGDASAIAEEMVERGVQPQMVAVTRVGGSPWERLVERGAARFVGGAGWGLPRLLTGCTVESDEAETPKERRERDVRLLAWGLAVEDSATGAMARQWLAAAPRLFPRDTARWYWERSRALSAGEQVLDGADTGGTLNREDEG